MIFAVETEGRALHVFSSEDAAVAHCEGLDVEAAVWLFWGPDGTPLEAEFLTPNKRGMFVVGNGTYRLVPARADHHAELREALDEVLRMEANPFFESPAQLSHHLDAGSSDMGADA